MAYRAELYEHDLDRQAADALKQFPKFIKLLESYSANYDEKAAKIDLLSTAIRLGEKQMPEVYGLLPPICEQLGIDAPELYYVKDTKRDNLWQHKSVHLCNLRACEYTSAQSAAQRFGARMRPHCLQAFPLSLHRSAVGRWYRPKPVSAYSGHWQISHADISEGTSILGSLQ